MKIGELAKKSRCKVVTIRYYEKEGLLPSPERTEGNYRIYGESDLERLEFIRSCRKHGMTLGEVRQLLSFRDNPKANCTWVGDLIDTHIADVDKQIEYLQHLKYHLLLLQKSCSGDEKNNSCGIIKNLESPNTHCAFCPLEKNS